MSGSLNVLYQLQYRITGTDQWINWAGPIPGDSEIVTGLIEGTSYDFRTLATNSIGTTISPQITIITAEAPPGPTSAAVFFAGLGNLILVPTTRAAVRQTLKGTGSVTVQIQSAVHATAVLSGTGQVVSNGLGSSWGSSIAVTGTATASATVTAVASTALPGAGSVTSVATTLHNSGVFVAIAGAGAVTAAGTHGAPGTATLAGTASATVLVTGHAVNAPALISGAGSVAAYASLSQPEQWSSTQKFTDIVLSNNNLTATEAVALDDSSVFANTSVTTGKYYWEIYISCADATQISIGIGNVNASVASQAWIGSEANGLGWIIAQGGVTCNQINVVAVNVWPIFGTATTCAFALDMTLTTPVLYGRVANGPWFGAGAGANPATATGGLPIPASVLTAAIVPGCTISSIGDYCIGNFSAASWLYAPPSGFVSLDTAHNPMAPANVTPSVVGANSVTLTWTSS